LLQIKFSWWGYNNNIQIKHGSSNYQRAFQESKSEQLQTSYFLWCISCNLDKQIKTGILSNKYVRQRIWNDERDN
jgi:hypothetical protein